MNNEATIEEAMGMLLQALCLHKKIGADDFATHMEVSVPALKDFELGRHGCLSDIAMSSEDFTRKACEILEQDFSPFMYFAEMVLQGRCNFDSPRILAERFHLQPT